MTTYKDPTTYTGQPICPRCGSGCPCCADRISGRDKYTHEETCARYQWADYTCGRCSLELALQNDDLRENGFSETNRP